MNLYTALILDVDVQYVSLSSQHTSIVHFEVHPTLWVSRQSKAGQHYLVVIHRLLFVRLVTNNHVKKPSLLELTPVFSAGCFVKPSYKCHPLLRCVLRGSEPGLQGAQVSSTLSMKGICISYLTCLYEIEGAVVVFLMVSFLIFFKVKMSQCAIFENDGCTQLQT